MKLSPSLSLFRFVVFVFFSGGGGKGAETFMVV